MTKKERLKNSAERMCSVNVPVFILNLSFSSVFFDREDSVTAYYEKVNPFIHLILIFLLIDLTH